ncbi:MAG: AbrB/MazE/SpoVT family DNA-binding domain-containing protein [Defluviitaleaceae bacterium]|nr:AbrB/MazE/SpoVT family DNA-binding domain-containing protein [Defluviitaleaceae bacterium]
MKATGIVRRIDGLGRIVVPKEIRRTLRIREGDPLEIFTDNSGAIILKKYSLVGELGSLATDYVEYLGQSSGHVACIIDKDQVIAVHGAPEKKFLDKSISREVEKAMDLRKVICASRDDAAFVPILKDDDLESYDNELIAPIIAEGDVIGAVILLSPSKKMGEVESKLALAAAGFLGKQAE